MLSTRSLRAAALAVALIALPIAGQAQVPQITAPPNKYSPSDDVKLGQQAAAQVEKQLPMLNNTQVDSYVRNIGQRLVANIPPQFRHPEFQYSFHVANVSDINAFALPGGPMFVDRGIVQAVTDEGELAGVMAHELSHVALRHGTAQATKATPYEVGEIAGQIVGAIVGGTLGNVISTGSQLGIGTYFLKFSREYERQADELGAIIMARAGYDPVDMARLFQMLEKQGGAGAPQWLSDHPNPGNRYQYISQEAKALQVTNPVHDTGQLHTVQAILKEMPPAPSSDQIMKKTSGGGGSGNEPSPTDSGNAGYGGTLSTSVQPPSSRYRTYSESNLFQVSVPDNWQQLPGNNAVWFAPQGGFGQIGQQEVFTHGMQIGVAASQGQDLQSATQAFVNALGQDNPGLRTSGPAQPTTFGGRQGLMVTLTDVSQATNTPETIVLKTTELSDGSLLYAIGVAPSNEFARYQPVFDRVTQSVQITG